MVAVPCLVSLGDFAEKLNLAADEWKGVCSATVVTSDPKTMPAIPYTSLLMAFRGHAREFAAIAVRDLLVGEKLLPRGLRKYVMTELHSVIDLVEHEPTSAEQSWRHAIELKKSAEQLAACADHPTEALENQPDVVRLSEIEWELQEEADRQAAQNWIDNEYVRDISLKFFMERPPKLSELRPVWDAEKGTLSFAGVEVRKYEKRAYNCRGVLKAFQQQGWPTSIKDPLHKDKDGVRVNSTVATLNKNLRVLKFSAGGDGASFKWGLAPS